MLEVRLSGTNKQRGQELLLEQMRVLKEKSDAGKVTGHDLYEITQAMCLINQHLDDNEGYQRLTEVIDNEQG